MQPNVNVDQMQKWNIQKRYFGLTMNNNQSTTQNTHILMCKVHNSMDYPLQTKLWLQQQNYTQIETISKQNIYTVGPFRYFQTRP